MSNGHAGPICPRCHQGYLSYLRLADEWEERLRKKWGYGLCEDCKRQLMYDAIARGIALAWDLPGHVTTNAKV